MTTIGITGGIGGGKSVVSQILCAMDIPVYNSDIEAKKITETSEFIKQNLINRFGVYLYVDDKLDKAKLASLIFNNEDNLKYVNSLIHPEVFKDFERWKSNLASKEFVGIESAILFESDLYKYIDISIAVSAPQELRIQRVQKRDKTTVEDVMRRINKQLGEEERNKLADYIVLNNETQALIPQVEKVFSMLSSK
ncbi:dephospho-CoA kinase [Dysgonomonadaceae bacterium PH5-43]|nr:dephospho-CoA kinase [Dysgonomonadaceae bacterium PH5-43]